MSISRRKFTRMALLGSASFTASSGIFFPKPAQAHSVDFPVKKLSVRLVFGELLNSAGGKIIGSVESPPVNQDEAWAIKSAEQKFVQRQFVQNGTPLAKAGAGNVGNLLWGRQKQETLGPNAGFGFVQKYQDSVTAAQITGPTMTGIHLSNQFLVDQRLTPSEIAGSLLPVRSQFDDWGTWEGDDDPAMGRKTGVGFTQYRTALGEVTARYELVEPGHNGFGRIYLIIEAAEQPRRDVTVTVTFR